MELGRNMSVRCNSTLKSCSPAVFGVRLLYFLSFVMDGHGLLDRTQAICGAQFNGSRSLNTMLSKQEIREPLFDPCGCASFNSYQLRIIVGQVYF